MQCLVWHADQTAVFHCPAAILKVAVDLNPGAASEGNVAAAGWVAFDTSFYQIGTERERERERE